MSKTINITDIKLRETLLTEDNGKYTASVLYGYMSDDSKEYNVNRTVIKDEEFTTAEKKDIAAILSGIAKKIKTKEDI